MSEQIICRRCEKEASITQNGLCNDCIPKVSFMYYWRIEDPSEAVRLFIVQDLNKQIQRGDEKLIKKLKPLLVNGILNECPKSLEEEFRGKCLWGDLLEHVQKAKE